MPSDGHERIDGLERLANLLEAGRISHDEFDQLKSELLRSGGATGRNAPEQDHAVPEPATMRAESSTPLLGGSVETQTRGGTTGSTADSAASPTPAVYKVAFGLGIASIFFGGTLGLLAWATVAVGGYALFAVKSKNRRWMAWTGLVLGFAFSFLNAYLNGHVEALTSSELPAGENVWASGPTTTTTTTPTTTSTIYAAWKTNGRKIAGTQDENDFLVWLRSSGMFNMSSQVEEVGLVEEGLWFCRAMDNGMNAENAFQQRADQWLQDMAWLVDQQPEQLDNMLREALTVMDAATHELCPEYGREFDRWVQSYG
jgi:hypothetical protein